MHRVHPSGSFNPCRWRHHYQYWRYGAIRELFPLHFLFPSCTANELYLQLCNGQPSRTNLTDRSQSLPLPEHIGCWSIAPNAPTFPIGKLSLCSKQTNKQTNKNPTAHRPCWSVNASIIIGSSSLAAIVGQTEPRKGNQSNNGQSVCCVFNEESAWIKNNETVAITRLPIDPCYWRRWWSFSGAIITEKY